MYECVMFGYFFFFFTRKTAYEVRISDWSSDVCSSDLVADAVAGAPINTSSALIISRARPADAPRPGARNSPAGLITAPTLSVRQASASIRTQPLVATTLVSRVPCRTAPDPDQRRPADPGQGAGADRSHHRRAGRSFLRGRARAGAGRWPGPRRDARAVAGGPRLHHLGTARADREAAQGLGGRDLGHGTRLRHHRLPQGRVDRRDHDVPLGDL